jgi:predicted Zn finger-like uncharacterized protein
MDVRCDQCETEYEFDAALVSQRGTTVKCTHCGHQFRVFPVSNEGLPELWSVRTAAGNQLTFRSLKELQAAIAARRVGPDDALSRGDDPPRPLSAIAELTTFFGDEAAPSLGSPALRSGSYSPPADGAGLQPDSPSRDSSSPNAPDLLVSTLGALPTSVRDSMPDDDDIPVESRFSSQRRAGARWIAGLVVIGLAVLLGGTVGRQYIARFAKVARQSPETRDQRVADFVEHGRRELDDGHLDRAERSFTDAISLAPRDPLVLAELARLEVVRADLKWLALRLIEPQNAELHRTLQTELREQIERAEQAVQRARARGAEPRTLLRNRVDLARIKGDLAQARRLVGPVAENAHLPENAYALATLDLADRAPVWSTVLDRLRLSSARTRDAGRARVALVYALVRAGHHEQAELELGKSKGRARPELLSELTQFVRRELAGRADGGAAELGDGGDEASRRARGAGPR